MGSKNCKCSKTFWLNEAAIQEVYKKRSKLQLLILPYLYNNINRIGEDDYKPNHQDILQARLRTSGVVEKHLEFKEILLY